MEGMEIFEGADVTATPLRPGDAALICINRIPTRIGAGVRWNSVYRRAGTQQSDRLGLSAVVLQPAGIESRRGVVQICGLGERAGAARVVGKVIAQGDELIAIPGLAVLGIRRKNRISYR